MALKDWKKIQNGWKKSTSIIEIKHKEISDPIGVCAYPAPNRIKWFQTYISDKNNLLDWKKSKTKSAATVFAKQYMRSH